MNNYVFQRLSEALKESFSSCKLEIIDDFGAVLSEIIRMLKPQSCLSPKMEELLMNMVKKIIARIKRNVYGL